MFQYEPKDFQLAEAFCTLALGTDAFYRKEQESRTQEASFRSEGLVPVNLTFLSPTPVASWQEAIDGLTEIYEAYAEITNPIRRNYMWQQVGSFRKLCFWLSGRPMAYREIVAETLFVEENPVPASQVDQLIAQMHQMLTQAGYTGSVQEQLAAWRQDRQVCGARETEKTLDQFLMEAKEKTLALGLHAIADFHVRPQVVYDVPYNAYCDYVNRAIYINGEVTYTVDELKHLVCHEAYPGHMTHMATREQLLRAGSIPLDAGLVLTNTASSAIFEGLADNGMAVLDWQDSIHDRICLILNQLQAIAALNAAHMLHAEHRSKEEAAAYLREVGFGSEAWVKSRLRFITFFFRAPHIYSYWRGWEATMAAWQQVKPEQRSAFLSYLYTNMHSIDTLLQFSKYHQEVPSL